MIPITKPLLGDAEYKAVKEVISSGWIAQGPKVEEFETKFARYTGSRFACAVSSGTTALHLALLAVGVKPEDAVITVSHSFIATANSVRYCGALPVFVDIDPRTFNMSPISLNKIINRDCISRGGRLFLGSRRVGAIMPVHQMGMPCDMGKIMTLAIKHDIPVVEDAACGLGSIISTDGGNSWKKVGAPHGKAACFSFHPRKIITTGEGGMVTTNCKEVDSAIRMLRNHGIEKPSYKMYHKVTMFEKYIGLGYNYRLTDIQAAIGIEQLRRLPGIVKERRRIAAQYSIRLKDIPWIELTGELPYCRTNWQSFPVRVLGSSAVTRDELLVRLHKEGISARRGIMNAHQEPAYGLNLDLKESERGRDEVILLPLFPGMRSYEIDKVVRVIKNA